MDPNKTGGFLPPGSTCPECGSLRAKDDGTTSNPDARWRCFNCGSRKLVAPASVAPTSEPSAPKEPA
jgi:transposase-like protein